MAIIGDATDLDTFAYGGANLLPDRDSYQLATPNGVVASNIAGGLTKLGLQYFNSPANLTVTYFMESVAKINYVKAFLRQNNGEKFIASLAVDYGTVEEYVVQYLGTPQISETGFNGTLRLSLEVQPSFDACMDQFSVDFACMGNDICEIFNLVDEGIKAKPNG